MQDKSLGDKGHGDGNNEERQTEETFKEESVIWRASDWQQWEKRFKRTLVSDFGSGATNWAVVPLTRTGSTVYISLMGKAMSWTCSV